MKVCLITHVADLDGAFPIILARQVFEDLDIISCEISEVADNLQKVLENVSKYDKIFIVDLNISEEMAEVILKDENLKDKVLVFDHHESAMKMNKYPFIEVVVENNNRKECGSTLFYKYLKNNYDQAIFDKPVLQEMLELIREGDTFDFQDELKDSAFRLGDLYNIYGRDDFISNYLDFINKHEHFSFTEVEETILKIEDMRNQRYIEEKLLEVRKATISGQKVGIVFAERKRSELGHAIAEKNPDIDIAIIININRSISYRANKDEVDVNVLAIPNGGGGHKHAAGSPLPNDLKEKICSYIYKDIEWL